MISLTFENWIFLASAIGTGFFFGSILNAIFQLVFNAIIEELAWKRLRGGRQAK